MSFALCLFVNAMLNIVVDDADAMATALVEGLSAPAPLRSMAGRGRALVLRRYDWDALAADLERSWERCL
jgi:glycosyltransferase involved in cell wall biosynthesis